MPEPINYEVIKGLAARLRWKVADLIVLAEDNDPYYCGRPAHRALGEWFAGLWAPLGFAQGVHLRRIHYVVVSQKQPVLLPDGEPYRNTEECWKTLVQASKLARYLGLVPLGAFVDRRNPDPHIFSHDEYSERLVEGLIGPWISSGRIAQGPLPSEPELRLPSILIGGGNGKARRYHVEVWVEKSTMNDVLVPLCREHGVNLITGLGEMSIPAVSDLIRRIANIGKEARVLYISDFDPGGQSMPRAVARKAEWLIRHEGLDLDLLLHRIVLTPEQIAEFDLPRTPIKESERRKAKFEDRHGEGACELDALEALHPGALADIVEAEIQQYHDDTLQRRINDVTIPMWLEVNPIEEQVREEHRDTIAAIEQEYRDKLDEMQRWRDDWNDRAQAALDIIEDDLRKRLPRILSVPAPQPAVADEPEALFDSKRSYAEQLFAYRRYGNGATNGQKSDDEGVQIDLLREACLAMGLEREAEDGGESTDPADHDDAEEDDEE